MRHVVLLAKALRKFILRFKVANFQSYFAFLINATTLETKAVHRMVQTAHNGRGA